MNMKVVFNILDESSLLNQIDIIKNYPLDCEVTTPKYSREYNHWTKQTVEKEY